MRVEKLKYTNAQTVVGVKDTIGVKALIVYPDGSIQRRFPDWKLVFAVSDPPKLLRALDLNQELVNGYLPIVRTYVEQDGVEYRLTSFAWIVKKRIVNLTKAQLINKSEGSKRVSFWFGLEGFTHTMEKRGRGFEKILKYTSEHLILDGFFALKFQPNPTEQNLTYPPVKVVEDIVFELESELSGLDPEDWEEMFVRAESRLREDCLELAARYDLELDPKEEKAIWVMMPADVLGEEEGIKVFADPEPEKYLRECENFWEAFLNRGMKIRLPEKEVTDFYKASLAYTFIERECVDGSYIVKPGATTYDHFWYRDGEGIVRAFDVAGYHKEAEESLDYFIHLKSHPERKWAFYQVYSKEQYRLIGGGPDAPVDGRGIFVYPFEPEKSFDCPNGQYDGPGNALKALIQHFKITGNKEWLEKIYPQIRGAMEWLRDGRKVNKVLIDGKKPSYYGLPPLGHKEAIEESPQFDHYIMSNAGLLDGVQYASEAAEALARKDDAVWMKTEYEDFVACLKESIERTLIMEGDYVGLCRTPNREGAGWRGLYQRWIDSGYTVRSLLTSGMYSPMDDIPTGLVESLEKYTVRDGRIIKGFEPFPATWMRSILRRPMFPQPGYPIQRGRNARALLELLKPELYKTAKKKDTRYLANNYCSHMMQIYMLRNEMDKAIDVFRNWINHAHKPTRAWIENTEYPSRLGHGDMPHGWIAALYVTVLREMLVAEIGDQLHITQCVPRGWLFDKAGITVKDAPTEFGKVDFTIRGDASNQRVEIRLDFEGEKGKEDPKDIVIHLRHPTDKGISEVKVDGKDWTAFSASEVAVPSTAKSIVASFA